jgi:hypothetical protein
MTGLTSAALLENGAALRLGWGTEAAPVFTQFGCVTMR